MSNKIKIYDEDTCREILRNTFKGSHLLEELGSDPTPLNIPRDMFDSVVVVTSENVDRQVYTCYSCKHGYFTVPYAFTDTAFNDNVTVGDNTSGSEQCWGVEQDADGTWFVYPSYSHTPQHTNYFNSFEEAFEVCESHNNKKPLNTSLHACVKHRPKLKQSKRIQYKAMTNFQYVLLHYPECIDSESGGGVLGCPSQYGLENYCIGSCEECYNKPAKRNGKYVFYRFIEYNNADMSF